MTEAEQDKPVMAGSDDATNDEKLGGLIEQVENDHGGEGAGAMADELRTRMDETGVDAGQERDTDGS